MPELRADLALQLDQALASLSELDSSFASSAQGFGAALGSAISEALSNVPPVELEADTSAITEALGSIEPIQVEADASAVAPEVEDALAGAESIVVVDADTAPADASLEDLQGRAEALNVQGTVDLDTSEAESALDSLIGKAGDAADSLGSLGGSGAAFSAAGDLATGSATGLGAAIGSMGGSAKTAVGIVAAGAAVLGTFFNEAVDAQGATQRFEGTLGQFAGQVEHLSSIKGLNTDLSKLALQLGSDDDEIRSVAARLFELADASGIAGPKASEFTQQMVALGARAVALNPQLGDIGTVTDSLSTALVRGGRFAAKYGLDLNQAEINSRALADTGKTTTAELTFVEKAMAGAAIASEKYGGNLSEIVAKGSENVIVTQRRLKQTLVETFEALGQPLIAPIFQLMEAALPLMADVGRILSHLGESVIPVATAAIQSFTGPMHVLADLFAELPTSITGSISSAILFGKVFGAAGAAVGGLIPVLQSIDPELGKVGASVGTLALVGFQLGGAWGAAAGAAVGFAQELFSGGESVEQYRRRIAGLASELEKLGAKSAATRFLDEGGFLASIALIKGGVDGVARLRTELEALGEKSPAALRKVVDGLLELRDQTGKPLFDGKAADQLEAIVSRTEKAFQKAAVSSTAATTANKQLSDAALAAAFATQTQAAAQERTASVTQAAVSAAVALAAATGTTAEQVRGAASAYASASQAASDYKTSLDILNAGTLSLAQAEQSAQSANISLQGALKDSKGSLDLTTEAGNKAYAAVLQNISAEQGYEVQLRASGASLDEVKAQQEGHTAALIDYLGTAGVAPEIIGAMLTKLGLAPSVIDPATRATLGLAEATGVDLPKAAESGVDEYGRKIDTTADKTSAATEAASKIVRDTWTIVDDMSYVGNFSGTMFANSMAQGISDNTEVVSAAARAIVRAAKKAADNAGSPSVHLFYDSGVEQAEAYLAGLTGTIDAGQTAAAQSVHSIADNVAAAGRTAADNLAAAQEAQLVAMRKSLEGLAAQQTAEREALVSSLEFDKTSGSIVRGDASTLNFLDAMHAQQQQAAQVSINKIEVAVHGVSDPGQAAAAGAELADAFVGRLGDHAIVMSGRVNAQAVPA